MVTRRYEIIPIFSAKNVRVDTKATISGQTSTTCQCQLPEQLSLPLNKKMNSCRSDVSDGFFCCQGRRRQLGHDHDQKPELRRFRVFLEDGAGHGGAASRRLQGHQVQLGDRVEEQLSQVRNVFILAQMENGASAVADGVTGPR